MKVSLIPWLKGTWPDLWATYFPTETARELLRAWFIWVSVLSLSLWGLEPFFLPQKNPVWTTKRKKICMGSWNCKQLQERFVGLQTCTSSLLFITAHDRQENLLPNSRLSQHPGGMDSCPTEYPESAGDQSCWCSSQWCQTYCERLAHQGKIRFLSLFSLVQYWQCTIFLVCSVHVNKKWVY